MLAGPGDRRRQGASVDGGAVAMPRSGKKGRKAGRRTVEIAGLKIEVVSDEECEQADAVVCVQATIPLYFADNVTGPCADCGDLLQWRPHAPKTPPKICMRCLEIRRIVEQGKRGG